MTATKIGTTFSRVWRAMTAFPRVSWLTIAIDTPHQVSSAFMVAAINQAANRYQLSMSVTNPALRCEQPGYSGKVDPAEGKGQDRRPAHTPEPQVSQQVGQGKIGRAEIKDLKGYQRDDDQQAKDHSPLDLDLLW